MSEDLLALAERLGAAIAADPRFRRLADAESRVLARPELKRLMEEYEQARLTIETKERALKPVEPEEKRAYAAVARRVQDETDLRDLAKAQADYAALMDSVNRTIKERIDRGFGDDVTS